MSAAIADLPAWARELLEGSRVARLGLLDREGAPRVLPLTYAMSGGFFWSAIDSKPKRGTPARIQYLREQPRVAFTVDHYSECWEELAWVQVLGTASIRDPGTEEAAIAALMGRYEPYRAEPPPGPLIRIEPERALAWRASDRER